MIVIDPTDVFVNQTEKVVFLTLENIYLIFIIDYEKIYTFKNCCDRYLMTIRRIRLRIKAMIYLFVKSLSREKKRGL